MILIIFLLLDSYSNYVTNTHMFLPKTDKDEKFSWKYANIWHMAQTTYLKLSRETI